MAAIIFSVIVLVVAHFFSVEGSSCNVCRYEGPALEDRLAYPCQKNYVDGTGVMEKVECPDGVSGCYFQLNFRTSSDGSVAVTRGGCLSDESKACMERTGLVKLDDKGTCSTAKEPVYQHAFNMNQCPTDPEGKDWLTKDTENFYGDMTRKLEGEDITVCMCKGNDCNGPDGPIKLV